MSGVVGAVRDVATKPEYLDVTIPTAKTFSQRTPRGHTVFAYVFEGKGLFGQENDPYTYETVNAGDAGARPGRLLDEPTTHLDPPHQAALTRLFRRRVAAGTTVVSVLHDLSLALVADRLVLLERGRVRAEGPTDDPGLHAALVEAFEGAEATDLPEGTELTLVMVDADDEMIAERHRGRSRSWRVTRASR